MTPDPNMTRTTPVPPLTPDQVWPNRHTPDRTRDSIRYRDGKPTTAATVFAARLVDVAERADELAENCRVLTELAQQLTNELHSLYDPSTLSGRRAAKVQAALNAAAELGITPQP